MLNIPLWWGIYIFLYCIKSFASPDNLHVKIKEMSNTYPKKGANLC